jgi:ABC-type Zn uptake system ZnuABC Zn-binding protein ZnuA
MRVLRNVSFRAMLQCLAVLLLITAAACGGPGPAPQTTVSGPVPLGPGDKLRVVATTNLVGDVVGRVGADRIQLTTLMAKGVDPHSYVPTPSDTAAVYDAHLLFANGAGLEVFLVEMLANAGGGAAQVYLSNGLQLRTLSGGADDPHVWFDVRNVVQWVTTIERSLSTLDPANAAAYQANAAAYTAELQALDAWIVQEVATIPQTNRKLVIDHPVFGYFSDRYGFQQIGAVYPLNPSAEPSAQDLAALEKMIRQFAVPAVFSENTVSPKLADQVAKDTGVKLFLLYTDSLGGPGTPAATYLDLMHYDVQTIVSALR